MTLDGFTLHFIVEEMEKSIIGCKVDKVHQPQPDTILLALRGSGSEGSRNMRVLLSAGAADSRMYITNRKYENPKSPPMFCMFLRKYLTGAKISQIKQTGLERIVELVFETKDELSISHKLTLVVELMGKYSNIILKNESNIIMDSLRHVTQAQSRVRSVLPSLEYKLPSSSKINPITASKTELTDLINKNSGNIKSYLSAALQGVSGQTAEEILFRYAPAGLTAQTLDTEKLSGIIKSFFTEQAVEPAIYFDSDKSPVFYSPFRFWSFNAENIVQTGSANELADMFYGIQMDMRIINGKRDSLFRNVSKHLEKQASLLRKQLDAIENSKKADSYKSSGDMITANIYRISKGMDSLNAEDYTTGETVVIKLDPRLSPSANAQANYRKYSKLKAGMDITLKRMLDTKGEIAFLESVQVSLESSESIEELMEIEFELSKAGVLPHKSSGIKIMEKPSAPHKLISSEGYIFYAGKNNRQNDILTMKTASPDDIWLHTKDIPGCHVIVTEVKNELPENTLFEAATVAATLSKAKGTAKIAVDYTPRKNVRKPNGAKPGMVIYEHYNTILVEPDKELFKRLLDKA